MVTNENLIDRLKRMLKNMTKMMVLPLMWCVAAQAGEPTHMMGTVTRVSDGDTLWLRPDDDDGVRRKPFKIRLQGIDAPERCQPWGVQAASALRDRLRGQRVAVTLRAKDDYHRWLGTVSWRGQDMGAWMVREGHAWSYVWRYGAGPYAELEREARSARRGLFATSEPMPPDLFRRMHGPCERSS
jgi:micrococcal nuclease